MNRHGVAVCFLLALAVVSSGSAAPDAFPGQNGRIAFMSVRANGGVELYSVDPSGAGVEQLTEHSPRMYGDRPVSWSPDGRSLVMIDCNLFPAQRALIVDVGTGRIQPLRTPLSAFDISWSPDGRHFAYTDSKSGGLWIARRDGGERSSRAGCAGARADPSRRRSKAAGAAPVAQGSEQT